MVDYQMNRCYRGTDYSVFAVSRPGNCSIGVSPRVCVSVCVCVCACVCVQWQGGTWGDLPLSVPGWQDETLFRQLRSRFPLRLGLAFIASQYYLCPCPTVGCLLCFYHLEEPLTTQRLFAYQLTKCSVMSAHAKVNVRCASVLGWVRILLLYQSLLNSHSAEKKLNLAQTVFTNDGNAWFECYRYIPQNEDQNVKQLLRFPIYS